MISTLTQKTLILLFITVSSLLPYYCFSETIKLEIKKTVKMPVGTHRPEVILKGENELMVVVVDPKGRPNDSARIKHQAYRYQLDTLTQIGTPFAVAKVSSEYGEPSDHRAEIVNDELVVVYQTNVKKSQPSSGHQGPAERNSKEQSLMLARFSLKAGSSFGKQTFVKPIVAHVTQFTQDNFPDFCIFWHQNHLLVSTGSYHPILKIRKVTLDATVVSTTKINSSESTVPGVIGNSFSYDGNNLHLFSATPPHLSAKITDTTLNTNFSALNVTSFPVSEREQNFPTDSLHDDGLTYIAYISRSRSQGNRVADILNYPYHPYLKIINKKNEVLLDQKMGSNGFMHVHPTFVKKGERIWFAYSQRVARQGRTAPQVVIQEVQITKGAITKGASTLSL